MARRKDPPDLTREEAKAFRLSMHQEAASMNTTIDRFLLCPGRINDVVPTGPGPRHAIVALAQEMASRGATYADVIGQTVVSGNGEPFVIREADLLGYVVANGYCTLIPPGESSTLPAARKISLSWAIDCPQPDPRMITRVDTVVEDIPQASQAPKQPLRPASSHPTFEPCSDLMHILTPAYRCPNFDSVCRTMRWDPANGHIPRGFLGATGTPEEVELVLVFAEPGDPHPGDHSTLDESIQHAYWAFREGPGTFHRNARKLFQLCWPGLTFDKQLRKVWMTESVLCSAEVTTGPVPRPVEQACGHHYLEQQLKLFPNALVVALGDKASNRLLRLGIACERAQSIAPPGGNKPAAYASWLRISEVLHSRRNGNEGVL
jgi:hypothetical protein